MGSNAGRRAVLLAALLSSMLAPGVARAQNLVVSSRSDAADASAGDGTCAAAGGGCTLRAAVQEADAADTATTIVVPAGRYRLTIPPVPEAGSAADMEPGSGDLDLSGELAIRGAGPGRTVIDGGGIDRVFETASQATVQISDLTVTGGDSTAGGSQEIDLGGAILNKGGITLDRVELVGNLADGGGGMFSIPGTDPVIRDSLIAGNRAYSGGGLRLDAGGQITNTTITGNALLTLPPDWPTTKPVGATVPTVDEISGWGGGIDNRGGDDVVIVNSTITANHALKGGGGLATGQGYAPVSEKIALGRVTLRNTIVAGNTSDAGTRDCHVKDQVIASLGHNLDSDGSCFLTAAGDWPKADPRLAALADNGGPTRTMALPAGSPAIGTACPKAAPRPAPRADTGGPPRTMALPAGSPAIDTGGPEGCPGADQRGVGRPQGRACDIGAFEYVAPAPVARQCAPSVRLPARL